MELYDICESLDDEGREKFLKELMDFAEEEVWLPLKKKQTSKILRNKLRTNTGIACLSLLFIQLNITNIMST